jgi:L-alanine-DL-glutamate epimerase-like enolase superfamily enzyme
MEMALNEGLGHGVNIKTAKSGITGSLSIMRLARKGGLRLMAGCMTETMTGLSAGIAMAMGTAAFDYVDLDSVHFLRHRRQYGEITWKERGIEGRGWRRERDERRIGPIGNRTNRTYRTHRTQMGPIGHFEGNCPPAAGDRPVL